MATPQPELNYCQDQSHEGRKRHILLPFHSKNLTKLAIFHDYKHNPMPCQSWQRFAFFKVQGRKRCRFRPS